MNKTEILGAFNNHINDFFNDVCIIFPDNTDLRVANTSLIAMRKANPRLIIGIWKEYIMDKYKTEIEGGDIDFFIDRNYKNDFANASKSNTILEKIDTLRGPVREMGDGNRGKTITYIQNLTKICNMYYQT